jgi:hypothetical protein
MRTVRIKKSDDVCVNCICYYPTDLRTKDNVPMGQCRRRCPQIVWHFPEKDIATGFPFVAVTGSCMDGLRKDSGASYLTRAINKDREIEKKARK